MMTERHMHKTKLYIETSLAANVKTTFSLYLMLLGHFQTQKDEYICILWTNRF